MSHRLWCAGIAAVAAFTLSGCYTTQANIRQDSRVAAPKSLKNAKVFIKNFEDFRPAGEKEIIGGVYNGYEMRVGDIRQPKDLQSDLKTLLAGELRAAGYTISDKDEDLSLDIKLLRLNCDARTSSEVNTNLHVMLYDKGDLVIDREYPLYEKKLSFILVDLTCSDPLNAALRKVFKSIIADIDGYLLT